MNTIYEDEIIQLRKKYLKNRSKLLDLSNSLQKEAIEYQTIEEQASRIEKTIHSSMMGIKSVEKRCKNLSQKVQDMKKLTISEKPQINNFKTFVDASKSVFSAKIFENVDKESKEAEVLQGRSGEILLEIASISEKVDNLKSQITDIRRAEINLKDLKNSQKNYKNQQIEEEVFNYSEKTIKVFYKSWTGVEECCDFPLVNHLGSKITFSELLKQSCRYWDLIEINCVLTDQELLIFPGSNFVKDELFNDKQVWLMTRQEANYLRAVNKTKNRDKEEEKNLTERFESEVSDTARNLEATQIADNLFLDENSKLEKERKELEEELNQTKARNKNLIHFLIYGLYIIGFTWTLLQFNKVQKTYWTRLGVINSMFKVNFPVESSTSLSFDTMNLYEDFKSFLQEPFLDSLYKSMNYNGEEFSDEEKDYVAYSYKKIGPVRFLQKKVKVNSCKQDFSEYLGRNALECYKDFSDSNEYKENLKIANFSYKSWTKYQSFDNPRQVSGYLSNYELNGYVAYFDSNMTHDEALEMINIVCDEWIDLQTRMLLVSCNFCNYNSDFCLSLDLLFEFIAGGGVLASKVMKLYRVDLSWRTSDKLRIAVELVNSLIIIYFLVVLYKKIKQNSLKQELKNFWNLLLLTIFLISLMKSFSMVAYSYLEKIKNFNDRSSEFIDYMTVAATYNLITSFTGFSCFISYFYILSFFQNSKGLKVIWGTLSQALYKLLFFFLVFILVFIGWVLLAYKGFGQYLEEYRNIGSTSTTLLKMLLGTVNFDQIYNVQPEFAGIFFFLFIFLNYFVMLNVFLAIINESYETIYSKIKTSDTDEIFIMLGMMMSGLKYALWTIPWNIILFRPCRSKRSV